MFECEDSVDFHCLPHIVQYGFDQSYDIWIHHGEQILYIWNEKNYELDSTDEDNEDLKDDDKGGNPDACQNDPSVE